MVSAVVRTAKLTDGEILALVKSLLNCDPTGEAVINYPIGHIVRINSDSKLSDTQLQDKNRIILDMKFGFGGSVQEVVCFHRGVVEPDFWRQHPNINGFARSQPHAYFDEIGFLEPERNSYGQQQQHDKLPKEVIFSVISLINGKSVEGLLADDSAKENLHQMVAAQIADLRQLNLEMTSGLAKARANIDTDLAKKTEKLDKEFEARKSLLKEQEIELSNLRKEINDREPQHERRRLREHLTERLQQTIINPPIVTGVTERRSYYFYIAAGAVFLILSFSLTIFSNLEVSGSAAFWVNAAKSLVAGVAGAAFTWAGLSGLKSSTIAAREHEQAVQRYAFDMDRASWIVETILQMNAAEQAEVPREWLENACRDLFVRSSKAVEDYRSLDAFAALFDATAKARIGTNGIEFEIDRKGARKLAHETGN
ncbi:hypothetical protein [Sphingobium sp. CECT 9361]|uniref:hypothetical protein n=1 Tax=Sphingobium sp. CECT 9361 TaxID=2845384 RepID=UPI001E5B6E9F|nr:hypothetical protein [Sphingobium sp. CECT 9361]CAH0349351.1 hypothetical protein SPH9361_00562 [Sphingobium sp. CECT 9361]